jgi:hypothetical protein
MKTIKFPLWSLAPLVASVLVILFCWIVGITPW